MASKGCRVFVRKLSHWFLCLVHYLSVASGYGQWSWLAGIIHIDQISHIAYEESSRYGNLGPAIAVYYNQTQKSIRAAGEWKPAAFARYVSSENVDLAKLLKEAMADSDIEGGTGATMGGVCVQDGDGGCG